MSGDNLSDIVVSIFFYFELELFVFFFFIIFDIGCYFIGWELGNCLI